jgi:hypothetical protein
MILFREPTLKKLRFGRYKRIKKHAYADNSGQKNAVYKNTLGSAHYHKYAKSQLFILAKTVKYRRRLLEILTKNKMDRWFYLSSLW